MPTVSLVIDVGEGSESVEPNGTATALRLPALYDSFIRYNMPVYPSAPRDMPFTKRALKCWQ